MKAHTRKDNEVLLVHIEEYLDPWSAIAREKELKDWNRSRELALVESGNPHWLDLSAEWQIAQASGTHCAAILVVAELVSARHQGRDELDRYLESSVDPPKSV